jgi:hypothetical protein
MGWERSFYGGEEVEQLLHGGKVLGKMYDAGEGMEIDKVRWKRREDRSARHIQADTEVGWNR